MSEMSKQRGKTEASTARQRFGEKRKPEGTLTTSSSRRSVTAINCLETAAHNGDNGDKNKKHYVQSTISKKDSVSKPKGGKLIGLKVRGPLNSTNVLKRQKDQTPSLKVNKVDSDNGKKLSVSKLGEEIQNDQLQESTAFSAEDSIASSNSSVDCNQNDKIKKEFSDIFNELCNVHIPTFQRKIEHVKSKREENTQVGNEIKQQIASRGSALKETVDEVMSALIREADDIRGKIDHDLNETQNVLETALVDLKSEAEKCKSVIDKDETEYVLESIGTTQSRVRELIPKQSLKVSKLPVFTTPSESEGIGAVRDLFGKVSINQAGIDGKLKENSLNEYSKVEIEILNSFNNGTDAIASICPVNSSSAYIRAVGSNSLNLVHSTGKIIKTVKSTTKINAFAVSSNGTIYMSCPDDQDIKKSNPDGSVDIFKKLYPLKSRWVSVTESGDVFVSVVDAWSYKLNPNSKRLIKKYSKEGKLLKNIEHENKHRLFQNPQKISSSLCGDIAVVDQIGDYKGKIVVVDKAGKLKFRYAGPPSGKSSVTFDPSDVCFYQDRSIIVADQASQSIHLIDQRGNFLKYLYSADLSVVTSLSPVSSLDSLLWIGFQNGNVKITKLVM